MDPLFKYLSNSTLLQKETFKEGMPFKEYARFPRILLEKSLLPTIPYTDVLSSRKSVREFLPNAKMSLTTIGALLQWSVGCSTDSGDSQQRYYPSGGAKYPLEFYVAALNVEGCAQSVYHYNLRQHALEQLVPVRFEALWSLLQLEAQGVKNPVFAIITSAIRQRTAAKYGELGYKLLLLEAGHAGQNFYLTAAALGIGCCALGRMDPDLNEVINLDGNNEVVVYGMVFGCLQ